MGTNRQTLLSVITVCRNSANTLPRTFDSVLAQEYRPVDYVVVDGASVDDTLDIIKKYERKFLDKGFRFRWISEPDEGIYDAMNKGIAMARGDIIGILNSDDSYEPDTLALIAEASKTHPDAGILYGFLRVLFNGVEILIYRYRYERYLTNLETGIYSAGQHPACFVRRSVYDRIGVFDLQFPVAADHDFLIRAMKAGIRFVPIDAVLSNFSSGGAADQMSDYERLRQRYGVFYKNGLLSESEYRRKQGILRYNKYKELKEKVVRWLFRY